MKSSRNFTTYSSYPLFVHPLNIFKPYKRLDSTCISYVYFLDILNMLLVRRRFFRTRNEGVFDVLNNH